MILRTILLFFAVAALACPGKDKKPQETKMSGKLVVHHLTAQDRTVQKLKVPGLTDTKLQGWVKAKLASSGVIELSAVPKRGSYALTVDLALGRNHEGEKVVLASARAVADEDIEGVTLQASAAVPLVEDADHGRQIAEAKSVVDSVLNDLSYQARLTVGSERGLVNALKVKDLHRLAVTVEIAAVRRARQTVPALIKLLKHEDERVSDRVIGALVAIGDRRAVKPLTGLSKFRDTARMAKILDAIGALGGKEAKEYLEFVASGHEDADIRNMATEALERMKRRETKKR